MHRRATSVDVVEEIGRCPGADWDGVVDRARSPVFYRHALLAAYERFPLAETVASRYLLARDRNESELGAVLPFYVVSRDGRGGRRRSVLAAYTHATHWYETDVPGATDPDALDEIWEALRAAARAENATRVVVTTVHEGTPLAHFLRSRRVGLAATDRCFDLDLTAFRDYDAYLASLAHDDRKAVRRHERRAAEAGAIVERVSPANGRLADAVRLCQRSADRHGNHGWYPRDRVVGLLRAASRLATLTTVTLDGAVVGAQICFRDARGLYAWAAGADYDASPRFSPSYVLWADTVRLAFELGVAALHAGRTNDDLKRRMGCRPTPTFAGLAETGLGRRG